MSLAKKSSGTSTVILEKAIQPKGSKPKFSRHAGEASSDASASESLTADKKSRTAADFCEQLLTAGFVQSYVDFYHLTHRSDPLKSEANKAVSIKVSLDDMIFIRDSLVEAEVSRRRGNTNGVLSAFIKLAEYYAKGMDWKTCIFFHQKCLDVSQLTADLNGEMNANSALGVVHQTIGDFEAARIFHERHEEISFAVDLVDESAKANFELYKVYLALANKLDAQNLLEDAMAMHLKSLDAAKKNFNKAGGAVDKYIWCLN